MGRPKLANPRAKQINLRFTHAGHDALREMAEHEGMALSDYLHRVILDTLRRHKEIASKNYRRIMRYEK